MFRQLASPAAPPLCCWEPLHECHHWHHRDACPRQTFARIVISNTTMAPSTPRCWRKAARGNQLRQRLWSTNAKPLPATPPPPAAPPRHRQHSPNRNYCHRAQRTPTPQGGRRAGRSTRRGRGKFVIVTRLLEAEVNLLFVTRLLEA
jgi:hypothetical protein